MAVGWWAIGRADSGCELRVSSREGSRGQHVVAGHPRELAGRVSSPSGFEIGSQWTLLSSIGRARGPLLTDQSHMLAHPSSSASPVVPHSNTELTLLALRFLSAGSQSVHALQQQDDRPTYVRCRCRSCPCGVSVPSAASSPRALSLAFRRTVAPIPYHRPRPDLFYPLPLCLCPETPLKVSLLYTSPPPTPVSPSSSNPLFNLAPFPSQQSNNNNQPRQQSAPSKPKPKQLAARLGPAVVKLGDRLGPPPAGAAPSVVAKEVAGKKGGQQQAKKKSVAVLKKMKARGGKKGKGGGGGGGAQAMVL